MKNRIIITFMFLVVYSCCNGLSIMPSAYETTDIVWLEATNSHLVACWADGTVCCWETQNWAVVSKFKLPDFDFETQELYISFNDRPYLASIYQWENLSFHDLLSAKKIQEKTFKDDDIDGMAFSMDGRKFYCSSSDNNSVLCLDVKTGKEFWNYEFSIGESFETYIAKSEEFFVSEHYGLDSSVERFDTKLIARNHQGEIKWDSGSRYYDYIDFADYGWPPDFASDWAAKPAMPTDIALLISLENESEIIAISLEDGKMLWKKEFEEGEELWAVTADRKTQVFAKKGWIRITNLPKEDEISIKGWLEDSDAIITPNGKYIYCLPKLRMVKYDTSKRVKKLARTSNILTVIDCEERIFSKEITLSKPKIN